MSDGSKKSEYIENADGSCLLDHKGLPISVDKFLSTKPLRSEVSTRKGPGGMKLSYMGGDVIVKTLNEAFGYDGWSLEVKDKTRLDPIVDDKGRYHIAYTATVRITHIRTGSFREDCGAGDALDKSLASACGNALKGAVTDAMKRAARHFGEKLGNSLYHDDFSLNKAPVTLKDACELLDIERANARFGFDKDRMTILTTACAPSIDAVATTTTVTSTTSQPTVAVKVEGVQNSHNYIKPTPLYVGGCVAQQQKPQTSVQSNGFNQPKTNNDTTSKAQYVTPHHGMNSNNVVKNIVSSSNSSHITPATLAATSSSTKENENANIQPTPLPPPKTGGLNLPKRPGTSRGIGNNSLGGDEVLKAFYGSSDVTTATSIVNSAPSMFDSRSGGMSQELTSEQQYLKRKTDGVDPNPNALKNPYK